MDEQVVVSGEGEGEGRGGDGEEMERRWRGRPGTRPGTEQPAVHQGTDAHVTDPFGGNPRDRPRRTCLRSSA